MPTGVARSQPKGVGLQPGVRGGCGVGRVGAAAGVRGAAGGVRGVAGSGCRVSAGLVATEGAPC